MGLLAESPEPSAVKAQLPLILTDTFETRESMRFLWAASGDFRTRATAF